MLVWQAIPDVRSRSTGRIVGALESYAPAHVGWTRTPKEADAWLLHVVGRRDATLALVERARLLRKKVLIVQYCVRSTLQPSTEAWRELWERAWLVWSYLPLDDYLTEDGGLPLRFPFYHAPLGADGSVFQHRVGERDIRLVTSGFAWTSESVRECALAAAGIGPVVHIGADLRRREIGEYVTDATDEQVASVYQRAKYVSGLRRTEGFELPAAEGLLCGARPILFDLPCYRHWYGSYAEYVPVGPRAAVQASIHATIAREPRQVRPAEAARAADLFSWRRVVEEFWRRAL